MDWDALFNYLGTGGGLIVLLNWLAGLPLLRRKNKLEKEDVSRRMAERDNETIIQLYEEVRTFQERLAAVEGCMARMVVCPIYDRCPARDLVSEYKRKYYYPKGRQPPMAKEGVRRPRSNTGKDAGIPDTDRQPPRRPEADESGGRPEADGQGQGREAGAPGRG